MNVRKIASAAVAGMIMAALPVNGAAAATVRASQAVPAKVDASEADRLGAPVGEQNFQSGGFPFLIVFVVIAAGLGLYFAVDGGDEDAKSPNA